MELIASSFAIRHSQIIPLCILKGREWLTEFVDGFRYQAMDELRNQIAIALEGEPSVRIEKNPDGSLTFLQNEENQNIKDQLKAHPDKIDEMLSKRDGLRQRVINLMKSKAENYVEDGYENKERIRKRNMEKHEKNPPNYNF